MDFEEALKQKQNIIDNPTNGPKEVYIIPEISEEGDIFLQLVLKGKIKYTDDLCKKYSSNGKYLVYFNPFS